MLLSEEHQDIMNELINIGIGDAAALLNEIVNCHVTLSAPKILMMDRNELRKKLEESLGEEISIVEMKFRGSMTGVANLIFSLESGKKLTNILSDEFEEEDYNTLKAGTLVEVGNILLNSVLASFSNALAEHLDYSIPEFSDLSTDEYVLKEIFAQGDSEQLFLCEVVFCAEDISLDGQVVLVFDIDSIKRMFESISKKGL